MSIEKIVEKAVSNDPVGLKEAFEEEMQSRLATSIEEKYTKMPKKTKNEEEEEGKECPHCEGAGYHEDEDGNKVECPECEGTGQIKETENDDDDDEEQVDEIFGSIKKGLKKAVDKVRGKKKEQPRNSKQRSAMSKMMNSPGMLKARVKEQEQKLKDTRAKWKKAQAEGDEDKEDHWAEVEMSQAQELEKLKDKFKAAMKAAK